jgi:hypothetical protein
MPEPNMIVRPADAVPHPTLSLRDAVCLIVGTIVGVRIFRTPSWSPSTPAVPGWRCSRGWRAASSPRRAVRGAGATCRTRVAIITTPDPRVRPVAFCSHGAAERHQTGAIVLLAFVLGDYASELLPLGPWSQALYAPASSSCC